MNSNTEERGEKSCRVSASIIFSVVGMILCYLLFMATRLQINYFDTFSLSLNAKSIALGKLDYFFWKRSPLLPVLLSPFYFFEEIFSLKDSAMMASRMLSVLFLSGLILISYKTYRLHLPKTAALWGMCLLSLNRLLIHHAPFPKEDIPSAFFTALAFYFYLLSTKKTQFKYFILTSIFISAAITARFNLLPLLFVVIATYELSSGLTRCRFKNFIPRLEGKATALKFIFFLGIPVIFFFALPSVLYSRIEQIPLWEAPRKFIEVMLYIFSTVDKTHEPFLQNFQFLAQSLTFPVVILSLLGFVCSWVQKREGLLFHSLWFCIFLLFQTFIIRHYEARYLFPLFVPLYYFAGMGFYQLIQFFREHLADLISLKAVRGMIIGLITLLILYFPGKQALQEAGRFQDPFYSTDFQRKISRYAKDLAEGGNVYWVGNMYPLYPRDYMFHPGDEIGYLYHFYNHVVSYFIEEGVTILKPEEYLIPEGGRHGVFVRGIGNYTQNGDVLFINLERDAYYTDSLPEEIAPLVLTRIRHLSFGTVRMTEGNTVLFTSEHLQDASLEIAGVQDGYVIKGKGVPDRYFELYFSQPESSLSTSFPPILPVNGEFIITAEGALPVPIEAVYLLGYDNTQKFYMTKSEDNEISIIKDKKRVSLEYKLKVGGDIKHVSENWIPLVYTHGQGEILPALEAKLDGLYLGDEKTILLYPEEAHGVEDPNLYQEVPIQILPDNTKIYKGLSLELLEKDGSVRTAIISQIKGETVVLNFNHPLAGKTMEYHVKILQIK